MRQLLFLIFIFTISSSLTSKPVNHFPINKSSNQFCGILRFSAENNMSVEDPLCVINSVRVSFTPGAEYYPNFAPGDGGFLGDINAPGSVGELFSLKILLSAYCNQVRLYKGGVLSQTVWNPPSQGGFVYFYNVSAACTTYDIVVE